MPCVYIIYSNSLDLYYTGCTMNLEKRLQQHNKGFSTFTRKGIPWKLVHFEVYPTKTAAMKREYEIKSMKSRTYIEGLISGKSSIEHPDTIGEVRGLNPCETTKLITEYNTAM